jgi:hypothetical protein
MDENEIQETLAPLAARRLNCSVTMARNLIKPRSGDPTYRELFEEFGAALFSERTRLGLAAQNETVEGTVSVMISWAGRFFEDKNRIVESGTCVAALRKYLADRVGMFAIEEGEAAAKARAATIATVPAGPAQPRAESESVPGWGEWVIPLLSPERVEALNSARNPTARYHGEPFKFYAQAEYFALEEKTRSSFDRQTDREIAQSADLACLTEHQKQFMKDREWEVKKLEHPFFRKFPSAFDWVDFRSRQASEIQARLDSQNSQKKQRRIPRR